MTEQSIACPSCGTKNRLAFDRLEHRVRCGRCQHDLSAPSAPLEAQSTSDFDTLVASTKVEMDPNKRLQLLKDAQKLKREQAPILWGNRYQQAVA